MNKEEALICYKATISIFQHWLDQGFISPEELRQIDTIIAEKYGISSCSIYRVMT